jgi:hypothetical protein
MIDTIDWTKLKPFKRDQAHSFEQLCYQIAVNLFSNLGTFTPIDGSGGDGGVEFYLTLANGDKWGWQAKFYSPNPRLDDSRKAKICNSLETACRNHPSLKKWFLCTPTDFTVDRVTAKRNYRGEQTWFSETLPNSVPAGQQIEIIHWGESEFLRWLAAPQFLGQRLFFFGELVLSLPWFKNQVEKQLRDLGDKFNPVLHIETYVDERLHTLLCDGTFVDALKTSLQSLNAANKELDEITTEVSIYNPVRTKVWLAEKERLLMALSDFSNLISASHSELCTAVQVLENGRYEELCASNWQNLSKDLTLAHEACSQASFTIRRPELISTGNAKTDEELNRRVVELVRRVQGIVYQLVRRVERMFVRLEEACMSELHVLGHAGTGKSHVAAGICKKRLDLSLPALFILGRQFKTGEPITTQLLQILDVPKSYSWNDFLQALSAAAEAYQTRVPMVIDGLNEATYEGRFSTIWRDQLQGLVTEISSTPNIVLITTCRESYVDAIWSMEPSHRALHIYGFPVDNTEEAVQKYFEFYNITADLTAVPLAHFSHPIYLRLFCEAQNPDRMVNKHVYVGEQTLFQVFDDYLTHANREICIRLHRKPETNWAIEAFSKLAVYLWEHRTRKVGYADLVWILDGRSATEVDTEHSLSGAVEAEGILLCRDWGGEGEEFYFAYDLLAGYLIAKNLAVEASMAPDLKAFVGSNDITSLLFSRNQQLLHPLHEDIRRCFAALLPLKVGHYLHDLTENSMAFAASVNALFELPPAAVSNDAVALIAKLFLTPKNRIQLLQASSATIAHVSHPLNITFWSKQLEALTMSDRDLCWSEYVRQNSDEIEKALDRFEAVCRQVDEHSQHTERRLDLLAEYVMWILTSTVRLVRDKATRALYWYGRRRPASFMNSVLLSLEVNDPSVSERMLAAAYGIAMACHTDLSERLFAMELLPRFAHRLWELMFQTGAPHSTTHILTRDYARHIVELALIHSPRVLTKRQLRTIQPPFKTGGIRKWGTSKDRNPNQYRYNHPMLTWGDDDPMGWLGPDISKYETSTPTYKRAQGNLWWRLYELGWSLEKFGDVDAQIRSLGSYGRLGGEGWTRTYGEKYRTIAAHELIGYRDDLGLLKHAHHLPHERWHNIDIDPSFPITREERMFDLDFLGSTEVSTQKWVKQGANPNLDLRPCLVVSEMNTEESKQGPWVLLDAYISATDKIAARSVFVEVRGYIIEEELANHFEEVMRFQSADLDMYFEPPSDYYTFAGEIPWADTYPLSERWELDLPYRPRIVNTTEETLILTRAGEVLTDDEMERAIKEIWPLVENIGDPHQAEKTLVAVLDARGLEANIQQVSVEREETSETFRPLPSVRYNSWEGYHSPLNESRNIATPARQITDHLGLLGKAQTFNLFDRQGNVASISLGHNKVSDTTQKVTYIRKDLIDEFLTDTKCVLLWRIWGQRRHHVVGEIKIKRPKGHLYHKSFKEVLRYNSNYTLSS